MTENIEIIDKFNSVLEKYIKKDHINHAYLIETNFEEKTILAYELIKRILSFETKITIDDLIKNNDLVFINSSSNIIKTDEIENLKNKYKTKSINSSKRIYVIDDSEKLNDFASNKLLKFLEEPEEDIVAIFLTENKKKLLKTIVSRCQLIRFYIPIDRFSNYDEEYVEYMFNFVKNIEENKEEAIAYQNIIDTKRLSDRSFIQEFLNNLLYIYGDALYYKITNKVEYFPLRIDKIEYISKNNTNIQLKNKINGINICIEQLKYNPNIKLLIDKLIIIMSGVEFQ